MNQPSDREEQAVLAALALLEAAAPAEALRRASAASGGLRQAPPADADAGETLLRLSVETLGLLAYAEEPAEPGAGARERLMAAVRAAPRRAPETVPATAGVVPLAAPRAPGREAPPGPVELPVELPVGRPAAVPRRRRPWLAALAAALVVAAVAAGWLYLELDRTRGALDRLEEQRARLSERLDRQEGLIRRGGQMAELITAVATPGVEVCPLRPVGDPPLAPGAYAVLYMPPGSGRWYLLASNLEPAEGVYQVWLDTDRGAVPAGVLAAGAESVLALDAAALGDLAGLVSIAVTVEPAPGMPGPEGPLVLFGDERMTVL